jgi:hypothetical protein
MQGVDEMTANARRLVLFQTIVLLWLVTSVLIWALFYPDEKTPGINLKEL